MRKPKRIKFEFRPNSTSGLHNGKPYYCIAVTDCTYPDPGSWFDKKEVENFCYSKDWAVTIVADDAK